MNRQLMIDALGLGALFAIAALAYTLGVRPQQQAYSESLSLRKELVDVNAELTGMEKSVREQRATLDAAQTQLASGSIRLEHASRINARSQQLTDIAMAAGLQVRELAPKEPLRGSRFSRVPINIAGLGSFQAVRGFLARLHDECRDTQLVAFSLVSRPDSPEALPTFSAQMMWYTINHAPADAPPAKR